jgi:hypothetical protein
VAKANSKTEDQDPTKGAEPILNDSGATVEIAGTQYPLRRLGVRDTFAFARIAATGAARMGQSLDQASLDAETMTFAVVAGLVYAEDEAMRLMASVISVPVKDLEDPDKFPMDTPVVLGKALAEHQDLKAFLASLGALFKQLPETKTRSRAQ